MQGSPDFYSIPPLKILITLEWADQSCFSELGCLLKLGWSPIMNHSWSNPSKQSIKVEENLAELTRLGFGGRGGIANFDPLHILQRDLKGWNKCEAFLMRPSHRFLTWTFVTSSWKYNLPRRSTPGHSSTPSSRRCRQTASTIQSAPGWMTSLFISLRFALLTIRTRLESAAALFLVIFFSCLGTQSKPTFASWKIQPNSE